MTKQKRATELLNIELNRISAALSIAKDLNPEKNIQVERALEEAIKGCHEAFEQMRAIANYASMI